MKTNFQEDKIQVESIGGLTNILFFTRNRTSILYQDISSLGRELNKTKIGLLIFSVLGGYLFYNAIFMFWGLPNYNENMFSFYWARLSRGQNVLPTLLFIYCFIVAILQPLYILSIETRGGKLIRVIIKGNIQETIYEIEKRKQNKL